VPPSNEKDNVQAHVSRWGTDLVWDSAVPHPNLELSDFPLRRRDSRGGLTLAELGGGQLVAAAGHEVEYDERRQLWFSDIEVNPGAAYSPFVRLALSRFQPHSVEIKRGSAVSNVHLSRVVLTDFAHLLPERAASVAFGAPLTVSLTGVGIHRTEIDIAIQEQRPDVQTDLGWKDLQGTTVQPIVKPHPEPLVRRWAVTPPPGRPTRARRLVIREYERFSSDPTGRTTERRLVYAEIFAL